MNNAVSFIFETTIIHYTIATLPTIPSATMKLYIYDHCPYCVRARMIFGLHQIPVEQIVLLNDDETTPINLIGSKQVPILEKNDGTYMGESLDIVRHIDENASSTPLDETIRPKIQAWFDKINTYYNHLLMPRYVQLRLPEFATQSAIDYFVHKKQATIGSFTDNLNQTATYQAQIETDLHTLESLVGAPDKLNGEHLSMEDIMIFPVLRNLSIVKNLAFPPRVRAYLDQMAAHSKVDLYFNRAI